MPPPQVLLRRWQVQMLRLMSNRKPTLKAKSGAEAVLLSPGRFRPRQRPPVTSFSGSLEHTPDRHLRRHLRHPAAGADQHNESLVRNTAAEQNRQFDYDYSTSSIL
jgi:hypothetical protein